MSLVEEIRKRWDFPIISTVMHTFRSLAEGRLAFQKGPLADMLGGMSLIDLIRRRGLIGAILFIVGRFLGK